MEENIISNINTNCLCIYMLTHLCVFSGFLYTNLSHFTFSMMNFFLLE